MEIMFENPSSWLTENSLRHYYKNKFLNDTVSGCTLLTNEFLKKSDINRTHLYFIFTWKKPVPVAARSKA